MTFDARPPVDSPEAEKGWRAHMRFDAEKKRRKAQKLISLIDSRRPLEGLRILDVGTGIGVISTELALAAGPTGHVCSIDTMDTRVLAEGYEFRITSGVELPFEDASFDVIVSNHVVEHVGGSANQHTHLSEIRRVLAPNGIGYVATPSRWALVEPHFKLPLLSWPGKRVRDGYVRALRKGTAYDVEPLGPREIRKAFEAAGLSWEDRTLDALDAVIRNELPKLPSRVLSHAPQWLLRSLRPAMPTLVYVVRPKG